MRFGNTKGEIRVKKEVIWESFPPQKAAFLGGPPLTTFSLVFPNSQLCWSVSVVVITSALHAEGRQFEPGTDHLYFFNVWS